MQIQNLDLFLDYLDKVHQRTMRVVRCIPPDKLDWSYREGNSRSLTSFATLRPSIVTCTPRPSREGRAAMPVAARN